jgi:hypothetical protein
MYQNINLYLLSEQDLTTVLFETKSYIFNEIEKSQLIVEIL